MKKILATVAAMFLVIGIVGSGSTIAAETVAQERVFDMDQVARIEIETDNVGVNVSPSADSSIVVALEGKESKNNDSFRAELDDSTLRVAYHRPRFGWFIFNLLSGFNNKETIHVRLPEKQYDAFHVSNRNGRIFIEQINANQIELRTNNGRVELEEADVQTLDAETNNGQIHLREIAAQNTRVQTKNGKITMDHVEGDIEGQTHNGKISLVAQTLDRNLKFQTHNGKITIMTAKEPTNVQFNVRVHRGKINLFDKYEGNATIGKGENVIDLTTHNGKIEALKSR